LHVLFAAIQIGLNDHANVFEFSSQAPEHFKRAFTLGRIFHIDSNKVVVGSGRFDNPPRVRIAQFAADIQTKLSQLERFIGIKRVLSDAVQHSHVFVSLPPRFGFRSDRLAEMIERRADPLSVETTYCFNRISETLAGNESASDVVEGFESLEKVFESIALG